MHRNAAVCISYTISRHVLVHMTLANSLYAGYCYLDCFFLTRPHIPDHFLIRPSFCISYYQTLHPSAASSSSGIPFHLICFLTSPIPSCPSLFPLPPLSSSPLLHPLPFLPAGSSPSSRSWLTWRKLWAWINASRLTLPAQLDTYEASMGPD